MDLVWKALKVQSRPIYDLIDEVFPSETENDVFLTVSEIIINEARAGLADTDPPRTGSRIVAIVSILQVLIEFS